MCSTRGQSGKVDYVVSRITVIKNKNPLWWSRWMKKKYFPLLSQVDEGFSRVETSDHPHFPCHKIQVYFLWSILWLLMLNNIPIFKRRHKEASFFKNKSHDDGWIAIGAGTADYQKPLVMDLHRDDDFMMFVLYLELKQFVQFNSCKHGWAGLLRIHSAHLVGGRGLENRVCLAHNTSTWLTTS